MKVLSGDNEAVVRTICRQVGVDTACTLNGTEIERLTDEELKLRIRQTTVFAKLAPMQKTRIITLLQELGHTVGFLGDGINDASALRGYICGYGCGHRQGECRHHSAGEGSDGT